LLSQGARQPLDARDCRRKLARLLQVSKRMPPPSSVVRMSDFRNRWLAKTGSGQAIVRTVETNGRKRCCSHRTSVAAGWVSQLRIPSSTLCENPSFWSHLQHTKGSICQDRLRMNMGNVEKNEKKGALSAGRGGARRRRAVRSRRIDLACGYCDESAPHVRNDRRETCGQLAATARRHGCGGGSETVAGGGCG
jgi:hypothetical protein